MKQKKCNMICLHETYFSDNSVDKELTGEWYHSFGGTKSRVVLIDITKIFKYVDHDGRIV